MKDKKNIQPDYTELKIQIPNDTSKLMAQEKIETFMVMFPCLMQLFKPMHNLFCEIHEDKHEEKQKKQPIKMKIIR